MKRYTNKVLAGLYIGGLALILVTLVVVRLRLDRVIELTV
jgi:hypothetical protein